MVLARVRRSFKRNYMVYALDSSTNDETLIYGLLMMRGKDGSREVSRIFVPFTSTDLETMDFTGEEDFIFYGNRNQFSRNRNCKVTAVNIFDREENALIANMSGGKLTRQCQYGGPIEIPYKRMDLDMNRKKLVNSMMDEVKAGMSVKLLHELETVEGKDVYNLRCPPHFRYLGATLGGVMRSIDQKKTARKEVVEIHRPRIISIPMGGMPFKSKFS